MAAGTADVTFKELEGFRHEPHHEVEEKREALYALVRDWLSNHIG
jgi:alpha-beta hydrolase superfamily lysophospholipase